MREKYQHQRDSGIIAITKSQIYKTTKIHIKSPRVLKLVNYGRTVAWRRVLSWALDHCFHNHGSQIWAQSVMEYFHYSLAIWSPDEINNFTLGNSNFYLIFIKCQYFYGSVDHYTLFPPLLFDDILWWNQVVGRKGGNDYSEIFSRAKFRYKFLSLFCHSCWAYMHLWPKIIFVL